MRLSRSSVLSALCLLAVSATTRAADIEKFLPKETDAVLSVNFQQILDSTVFRKNALDLAKDALAKNKEVQMAIKATGLDPMKDFDRVTIGLTMDDSKLPKVMVVIEGKFDPKKITDTLDGEVKKEQNLSTEKVGGKTVYKFTDGDKPAVFGAVIDAKVLVFGSTKEYIATAFDAARGTAKSEIHKDLSDLLAKADSQSSLYFAAIVRGKLEKLSLPDPNLKKIIQQVYFLTVDVKAQQDVDLKLAVGLETAEAAKNFEKFAEFGIDLLKAQIKITAVQNPELEPIVDLVNSLKVNLRGKALLLTGVIKGDVIEKAIKESKDK